MFYICYLKVRHLIISDLYKKYPTQEDCIKYLESVYWTDMPNCSYCKSKNQTQLNQSNRYHCNNCNTSYSVTVGTIFHKTKIDFQKWFFAIDFILNKNKNVSARELAGEISVTKDTAWRIITQIKKEIVSNRKVIEIISFDNK